MNIKNLKNIAGNYDNSQRMPVLFVGHGNPMNAILDNDFTRSLSEWGKLIQPLPKAILVISAHWLTQGTHVLITEQPETIHDFGGFPNELYQQQYPAKGSPEFGHELAQLVKAPRVIENNKRGLDHGVWSVLRHMYPGADVPVFQLSIDYYQPAEYHFDLARQLKSLRDKGVLIIGSGNIVHNLYRASFDNNVKPYDWAIEFDEVVISKLTNKDIKSLVNYDTMGAAARQAIPTNDHYLPMMYTLGLADDGEELKFTYEEIQNASISMRCFQIG